ncbi:uncharacterized protein LOC111341572 [Stylophora pistillata]|nr:uncharacterized protein LOC111341572 [Stylophora pistillata]
MRKATQSQKVFSLLRDALSSGKYWRCIRWCNQGTTMLITSSKLFEKEVLLGVLKELRLKDFSSFADMVYKIGFQRVPTSRPSKVYKFRHPLFQLNCNGGRACDENANSVELKGLQQNRKRKMMGELTHDSDGKDISNRESHSELLEPGLKRQRKSEEILSGERLKAVVKESKISRWGVKECLVKPCTLFVSANQCSARKQPVLNRYSLSEIIAAHGLLNLASTTAVQFGINDSPMGLDTARRLYDLFWCAVFIKERNIRELDAATALLELSQNTVKMMQ